MIMTLREASHIGKGKQMVIQVQVEKVGKGVMGREVGRKGVMDVREMPREKIKTPLKRSLQH